MRPRLSVDPAGAVADAHRREWAAVLAATVRVTRDLDLAEECVQEAYAQALTDVARRRPRRPGRLADHRRPTAGPGPDRRAAVAERALPLLVVDEVAPEPWGGASPDDLLALAVAPAATPRSTAEARVALTLRLVGGVSTPEIARAFLVCEPTMAARITRAKKKIAAAGSRSRARRRDELHRPRRRRRAAIHLSFTAGHTARLGGEPRPPRSASTVRLARPRPAAARAGSPTVPSVAGAARADAAHRRPTRRRVGPDGELVLLADQDRSRWDRDEIDEGLARWSATRYAPAARAATRLHAVIAARSRHRRAPTTPTGARSSDSTRSFCPLALACRVPQPCGCCGVCRWSRRGRSRCSTRWPRAPLRWLRLPRRLPRRAAAPRRPSPRGPGGDRGGGDADGERRGARAARPPARRPRLPDPPDPSAAGPAGPGATIGR